MPGLRCEVFRRDGDATLPCDVRTEDGRFLRLTPTRATDAAQWLGTLDGRSVWAEPAEVTALPDAPRGEILLIEPSTTDEIGIGFGPDADGTGLFDVSHTGTLTGERTDHHDDRPELRRTSVLAWIAAEAPGDDAPPEAPQAPCEPLKRLIADEPLDPLPALDGGPHVAAGPRSPQWSDADAFREDTATQIAPLPPVIRPAPVDALPDITTAEVAPAPEGTDPVIRRARVALLASVLILALIAIYLVFFRFSGFLAV